MCQKLIHIVLLFIVGVLPLWAYDAFVGGLYYNLNNTTHEAELADAGNHYSGPVNIPENIVWEGVAYRVTSIAPSAFYFRNGITEITIPSTVRTIGRRAFSICVGLTSVTIPNSVLSIGDEAFSSCSGLVSVTLPYNITAIGAYTFNACRSLQSITLPSEIKTIGASAFRGCCSLQAVTIPSKVTSIGGYAFSDCFSLVEVHLPASIIDIDYFAFSNCYNLRDFYCLSPELPQIEHTVFDGTHLQDVRLHVQASSMSAYWASTPWLDFGCILPVEDIAEGIAPSMMKPKFPDVVIYDLTGRPLRVPPSRGVYIQNQTKQMVP